MTESPLALRAAAAVHATCYAVGAFLPTLPEGAYSDGKVAALLADPGERTATVLAGCAFTISGLAFLVTVALVSTVVPVSRGIAARIALAAASTYAAMLMLGAVLATSLPTGVALGELPPTTDTTVFRVISNGAFHALLVPGLLAATVVLVAVSWGLRGVEGVPAWCSTLGLVLAPLLLVGAFWVPQFLVPVWAMALAWGVPRVRTGTSGAPAPVTV